MAAIEKSIAFPFGQKHTRRQQRGGPAALSAAIGCAPGAVYYLASPTGFQAPPLASTMTRARWSKPRWSLADMLTMPCETVRLLVFQWHRARHGTAWIRAGRSSVLWEWPFPATDPHPRRGHQRWRNCPHQRHFFVLVDIVHRDLADRMLGIQLAGHQDGASGQEGTFAVPCRTRAGSRGWPTPWVW